MEDGTGPVEVAAAQRLRLCRPADPTELGGIRRSVEYWAMLNALPKDIVIDLQLAVGEAVSNGVEHAYAGRADGMATVDVELEIRPTALDDVVAVRVADHGRWQPIPAQPGYRGRGLAMIERLSRGLRVSSSRFGTLVCFEIPLG